MKNLMNMKNKKGFTLIELIVVIAVLAILAAILLPRFTGFSESAKEKAVLSDARNYAVAVQALVAEGTQFVITAGDDTAETAVLNYSGLTIGADQTFSISSIDGDFTLDDDDRGYTATYDAGTGAITTAKNP